MKLKKFAFGALTALSVLFVACDKGNNPETPQNPENPGDGDLSGMFVSITDVTTTTNSITFTVTSKNVDSAAWTYEEVKEGMPEYDATDVMYKGKGIQPGQAVEVTAENLKENTEYMIYAAVESPTSYDRKMVTERIRTKAFGDVENTVEVVFNDIKQFNAYNGYNYVFDFEDEQYGVHLDIYGEKGLAYVPYIMTGTYTYDKSGITSDWQVSKFSYITDISTGNRIELEKGTVTVSYSNGTYTIATDLVSSDNVQYKFSYEGNIEFAIKKSDSIDSEIESIDGKSVFAAVLDGQVLNFEFTGELPSTLNESRTFTIGNDLTCSLYIPVRDETHTFKSGSATFTKAREDDEKYSVSGMLTTDGGYNVKVEFAVYLTPKEKPQEITTVFTVAEAMGYTYEGAWVTEYSLTLKNDDWQMDIDFSESGYPDELPATKITLSDTGSALLSLKNLKDNSKYTETDLSDVCYIHITKEGNTYTVSTEGIKIEGLGSFSGTYTGEIECESYL